MNDERVIRIRCLGRKCQWVGYRTALGGHVVGQVPTGEWLLTYCPRCGDLYAAHAR